MNRATQLIVPALLAALAGLAGCRGQGQYSTGMPVVDRWISPAPVMEPESPDFVDPQPEVPPTPVPAPAPPSALLSPEATNYRELPELSDTAERRDRLYDYFFDGAGHTPVPGS